MNLGKFAQVGAAIVAIALTGGALAQAAQSSETGLARSNLTIIAPAAVGGGWDGFSRESQAAMRGENLVNNAKVVNIPGAGGTIGLRQLVQMQGDSSTIMATGAAMVGGVEINRSAVSIQDATPLVRLADDYIIVVVPADSPYKTFDDVLAAWKENPKGFAIAGGSLGSVEHLAISEVGRTQGIEPRDVNFVAYSGGGEVLSALLSRTTEIGVTGYNDFADQLESGTMRALAISSPERLEVAPDIPTLTELGVPVEMANWRGFLAPPGISDEEKRELVDILTEMEQSEEWQDAVQRNGWFGTYMAGDELEDFIDSESLRTRDLVKELGL
ncbi:Tripartite tricarboxylate transporter family receptor [Corynebacterium glaucum]|uniref:Tripartite tricarboxylate transporter family receptor n=1 Tax=Corynebacterium glaucum TaxID=187491 RepID=A0A1Q2HXE2_9CORY|nr:tripartite tricarboxylate transporter substrate-binding protein [Corynebacterium glaucum]AQQ15440.1 Tripartite tricarboxylate transporter family receptor [Corynebacterium glaucum]WJZ07940.1 Tripartite tricarboxylate transporter family receptor [Corynebacterium glaucum]